MAQLHKAVRGMRDILPEESQRWLYLENAIKNVMHRFAYEQVRLPVLEPTALFKRSIGQETDIVGKEMYTFDDRNGDSLSLRPEGTASCLRAGIEHGLFHNQRQKLWYQGAMFRYERPQQGRYRQFEQWGVEAIGYPGVEIEAELLEMTWQFWNDLGVQHQLTLELNSLGDQSCRAQYRELLQQYFSNFHEQLSEPELKRLRENPLRLLDSKNPKLQKIIAEAPCIDSCWSEESTQRFALLRRLLDQWSVPYQVNTRLMRGLDYYQDTVFEWVAQDHLGAQNTVCAGGRYDGLVETLGGPKTHAFGFAAGLDRLLLLPIQYPSARPHVAVLVEDDVCYQAIHQSLLTWRTLLGKGIVLSADSPSASLKSQRKRAQIRDPALFITVDRQGLDDHTLLIETTKGRERVSYEACEKQLSSLKEFYND